MSEPGLSDKKRKHHHVWRYYLGAWTEDDQVWCLCRGKIFRTGLMVVAQEKNFYRQQKLAPEEISLVRRLFVDQHKGHPMWTALENWISLFEQPFQLADKIKALDSCGQISNDFLEVSRCNAVEDMHMHFEIMGRKHLDLLRQGDISFFQDQEDAIQFLLFLCVQYFRTKGQRKSFLDAVAGNPLGDLKNAAHLISILISSKLSHNLYVSGQYHLQLLENKTRIKFITGDQPVVNTHCYERNNKEAPKKLEFYYPVTPERAVLVTENPSSGGTIMLTLDQVNHYNAMMVSISAEQLFATSEAQLLGFVPEKDGGKVSVK